MTGCTSRRNASAFVAERDRKLREQIARMAAARRDIMVGKHKGWIMREHGLSQTAYEQLAGQVRAGFVG